MKRTVGIVDFDQRCGLAEAVEVVNDGSRRTGLERAVDEPVTVRLLAPPAPITATDFPASVSSRFDNGAVTPTPSVDSA